jgi:c-di-GMP-binding flagellar brake protein YcgR
MGAPTEPLLSFFAHRNDRREVRRSVRLACRVVREDDFKLIGARALDVSPGGMLVMCIGDAKLGDSCIVSFKATELGIWFDMEAVVARVIRGKRAKDRGRCVGLRFTKIDPVQRLILRGHLRRSAPPVPHRAPRIDYAGTIRKIAGLAA